MAPRLSVREHIAATEGAHDFQSENTFDSLMDVLEVAEQELTPEAWEHFCRTLNGRLALVLQGAIMEYGINPDAFNLHVVERRKRREYWHRELRYLPPSSQEVN